MTINVVNNRDKINRIERENSQVPTFGKFHLRGLLTVNTDKGKKGIYIAEYATGGDPNLPIAIAIYGVREVQNGDEVGYDKAFDYRKVQQPLFSDKTILGQLKAKELGTKNTKESTIKEYFPPKFITKIEDGVDTFTGKRGQGFYEEEPTTYDLKSHSYTKGKRTGVFIGLDSFKWGDAQYRLPEMCEFADRLREDDGDLEFL